METAGYRNGMGDPVVGFRSLFSPGNFNHHFVNILLFRAFDSTLAQNLTHVKARRET